MQKNLILSLSAVSLLMMSSCSGKLKDLSADNFTVTPNPLETQGGQVTATIDGTFPQKYMKKKAVVTVIPQLRYAGQSTDGAGQTFQGEKVLGNDQVIQYKVGGKYTMKTTFAYKPEMQKSDLYLTFDAKVGKKQVEVPAVKVADGIIATSELYKQTLANAGACIAPDSFQRVRAQKQEANIKYLINQANIRKSELKNNSVKEFVDMLKKINADQKGLNMKNVEVLAYASPDGGVDFNDKLASKRQGTSEDYVKKTLKQNKMSADVDANYTAQDWDGFQQLVSASNLQDKDVILRVLSMYKDPQEREQQIRNMSSAFRELADGILPELRRSRLIINYETVGRSDDEIKQQYADDASKLSADELLYCATLTNDNNKKAEIYKKAAELYPNDYRTYNNVAAMAFNQGNEAEANSYLQKAFGADQKSPEANANLALIALKNGNLQQAEAYVAKANDANDLNQVLGNLNIAKGNYAQAQDYLKGSDNNSAALAQLLNKDYASADATLRNIKNKDGMTYYLQALLAARQGDTNTAASCLRTAVQKDPKLAQYAANDLELSKVSK
ncbi:MAG: hypothetical protein MR301_03190 [Prevotella sp.]|nr:hypothetical protein [Prevotella sp.]MDD7047185.1 hypothetical protein [Prevotella sp.]MDY5547071.1 hypothetical protein [Prevotella sp.]